MKIDPFSYLCANFDIQMIDELKKWNEYLETIGGPFLVKTSYLTKGWMMANPIYELLPTNKKETISTNFKNAVTGAVGKKEWEHITKHLKTLRKL